MLQFKVIFIVLISFFLLECSKDISTQTKISEKNLESQVIETYNQGMESLKQGDVLFAAKKFNEAEMLFPQSDWAPKSALMAAYSYYTQDYYGDAIAELDRFLKIYPYHENINYAYYLLGISYYEQIVDEKKDLESILNAKNIFNKLIDKFPNTEYALDAKFKLNLINDILASKEIYLGRYYLNKQKWIPAINRFKTIVDEYEDTIYIEEALYRMVEVYYILGLKDEAQKYASLLGYNYQSSEWYSKSYSVFNKSYKKNRKENEIKNKNNSIIKKIISFF